MAGPNRNPRNTVSARRVTETREELNRALGEHTPACLDDPRFTDSRPAPLRGEERKALYLKCFSCPIFDACAAYAQASKPAAGYWAGKNYGTWERKP